MSTQTSPDQLNLAELQYLSELGSRLSSAKHGTKGTLIDEAADFLNLSKAEVYRRVQRMGFDSKRKSRADKGKCALSAEQARMMGNMVYEATRKNGKRTTSIKLAAKIAAANGVLPEVSTSTIIRAMNANHCHPTMLEAPTAHIEQRSLHPNHVWQVDASTSTLFYLPKESVLQDMHPREFNKNKPQNLKRIEKDMLTRYVVTDHYSGAIYLEYVRGSESAQNLITVLLSAMQNRGHTQTMHGVPLIIYTDKGSAMTSHLFVNLLDRLDIRIIDHAAGNPRAKGQVESTQNIVENEFEGRLKSLEINTLEQINALAADWQAVFNATSKHSRTGSTRQQIWNKIKPEQLRLAPTLEVCKALVTTRPITKQVKGNLTITHTVKDHGNLTYRLDTLEGIYPRAKVEVVINAYRMPDIDVHFAGESYTLSPVVMDEHGIFSTDAVVIGEAMKSPKQSLIDQAKSTAAIEAYGVSTEEQLKAAIKRGDKPYQDRIDVMADIKQAQSQLLKRLPKRGQALVTPSVEAASAPTRKLAPLTHMQAAKQLRGILLGVGMKWTAHHFAALSKQYPTTVPAEAIEDFAQQIIENPEPAQSLRVV